MDRLAPVRAFLDSLPCAVYSRHESLCRLGNSQTVVVFVHGIQGSPSQFGWLMDVLPPETDFVNLLLPGHGRSVRAFRKAGKADWENTVSELVRLLSRTYRRIIWVGHSMGCLLGLHAARLMPDAFSALLLNCPFILRPYWGLLRMIQKRQTRPASAFDAGLCLLGRKGRNRFSSQHGFCRCKRL